MENITDKLIKSIKEEIDYHKQRVKDCERVFNDGFLYAYFTDKAREHFISHQLLTNLECLLQVYKDKDSSYGSAYTESENALFVLLKEKKSCVDTLIGQHFFGGRCTENVLTEWDYMACKTYCDLLQKWQNLIMGD